MSFEQGSLSIDDYIAQFEALCKRAKWPRNTPGTIQLFRNGLKGAIHHKIMDRKKWPETLDAWQKAARNEVE